MTDDMHHRETLDEIESRSFTDTDRNQQLRLNISMETRILRLEDEFWRIRTDTGELAETERNALRAYLDEKGFKTAMIDDNLVIAGKLTWTEVFEPIEGFYEGKADVHPFNLPRGQQARVWARNGTLPLLRHSSIRAERGRSISPLNSPLKERKFGRSTVDAFTDCVWRRGGTFRADSSL